MKVRGKTNWSRERIYLLEIARVPRISIESKTENFLKRNINQKFEYPEQRFIIRGSLYTCRRGKGSECTHKLPRAPAITGIIAKTQYPRARARSTDRKGYRNAALRYRKRNSITRPFSVQAVTIHTPRAKTSSASKGSNSNSRNYKHDGSAEHARWTKNSAQVPRLCAMRTWRYIWCGSRARTHFEMRAMEERILISNSKWDL